MILQYSQTSPDEIARIAALQSFQQIFEFKSNAVRVNYNAKALRFNESEITGPTRLDAYKKVVEQIRQADADLSARQSYEEPVIEEEQISYPTLRDIDTRPVHGRIHRLRRF